MTFRRKPEPRSSIEYAVPGDLRVRAIGAGAADLQLLDEMFGPGHTVSDRPADLTLRFSASAPALGEAHTRVTVRKGPLSRRSTTWAGIDFQQLDRQCEAVYPRDAAVLPFLKELLAGAALRRGWVALHASALLIGNTGVLLVGPAHSGKTGLLLALRQLGAEIVGDDCVLLAHTGRKMLGLERRIGISVRHLKELASVQEHLSGQSLYALRAMAMLGLKGKLPVAAEHFNGTGRIARGDTVVIFLSESTGKELVFESCTATECLEWLDQSAQDYRCALTAQYADWRSQPAHGASRWMEDARLLTASHLQEAVPRLRHFRFTRRSKSKYGDLAAAVWDFVQGGCSTAGCDAAPERERRPEVASA